MAFKQIFAVLALVLAVQGELPAGLFPALCPNYPYCDNELLARYSFDGTPKVAFTFPVPGTDIPVPRVAEYPPGVHPSACPNYPFCNTAVSADPLPGFTTRLYPAGVHPSACPGYPYC